MTQQQIHVVHLPRIRQRLDPALSARQMNAIRSVTKKGVCREANTLGATSSVMERLLQGLDARTEIDMEYCPIHHQGRHGLDTDRLCFLQA